MGTQNAMMYNTLPKLLFWCVAALFSQCARASWTEHTLATKDWSAVASSSDGSKLVAAERLGNLWTSTDSGSSWTEHPLGGTDGWSAVASSSDGSKLLAAASLGNLWTSTDSGSNWTEDTSI